MKSFLLAAAALIAAPAIAQDQPAMADQAATTQSAPAAGTMQTSTDPNGMRIIETPGGYEPAGSPLKGTPEPGSRIVFQPAPPPSVAFPPPPPLPSYPPCKKGQYNNCMQRGGK
ncbi:hypothetical protein [Sphingomonas sp.]|jgi:hypothetical protein|uniref:hypothetical protein n=1 Tax=Sphingomonas sp. TaxID=28214 RepID=UPI00260D2EEB|nr:hypothetical protein [Sphingomonas sp.]MDF2493180.1 hypothetical protein [Sphingomonas sp.]